ncbi:hypothetical protein PFISCL1PPCAC_13240, partial [Pristionchus fissidentatus]
MNTYYISVDLQRSLSIFVKIIFALSTVLSGLTFFCLVKVSDATRSGLRKYLIYIQCLAYLHDVYLEILYKGFPLFPMLGGYCYGLLCHWASQAIVILIMGNMGAAIVMCIIYRHQSIIPPNSPLKFNTVSYYFVY